MSIAQDKQKVFSEISALRVSAEGYPKMILSNSIDSLNEVKANSLDYLTDLLKSLIGFDSLKDVVVETLTQNLDEIEDDVKIALKEVLKNLISCSVNPKLPQDFIDNGITISLKNIDFLDIMRIAPTSEAGNLLYYDVVAQSQSSDFNTFLYSAVQNNGAYGSWGSVTTPNDILDIKFDEVGTINNTLTIKPSSTYPSDKLVNLNNDFIDSLNIFNSPKLINNIIESIFGSISFEIKKDKKTIQQEIQIDDIINRILDADDDETIDDSYFSFSNDEIQDIEYRARLRRNGTKDIGDDITSSIPMSELTELNNQFDALNTGLETGEYNEKFTVIVRDGLDRLADVSAQNSKEQDKSQVKLNFIEDIIKKLMTAVVNVILSPKLIIIFAINHQIIYGDGFEDVEDFMKKNKWLITLVLERVRDVIVSILMAKALKEIKKLIADNVIKVKIEKYKAKKAQLLSLTGVPNEILRKISGLTKT